MLVSEDLIRRIEISEAGLVRSCAKAFGGKVFDLGKGVAANCGPGNVMTQCVGLGLEKEVTPSELGRVVDLYEPDCERFEFKLSPLSPMSLREWVVRRAAALPEFETLMVRDLSDFSPVEPEVEIHEVDADEARGYATRAAARFYGGDSPPGLIDVIAATCVGTDVRSYEAYADGRPVAGCSVGFANGIAWLAGAAVEPAFRGKGLHKAMQAHRLAVAKGLGFNLVCQGALPGSISQQNAQKSGFQIAFTRPTFMVRVSRPA